MNIGTRSINWVVKSLAAAGKHSGELNPFEFAILDKDTYTSLALTDVMGKELVLAVGSPNMAQATDGLKINRLYNHLNTDVSFKSGDVTRITNLRFHTFDKDNRTNTYYLGYNNLDNCKSLKFECGKTYQFHIHASGRPVRNVYGREMAEIVEVTTPCCDASCGCPNGVLDCSRVIDLLVENIKTNIFWVNRFFDVSKVMTCSPAPDPLTTIDYEKYCVTVCDSGRAEDLANVQNQYPTLKVTLKSRVGVLSTYEFTQLAIAGAPTNFSQSTTTLVDCGTCPAGFTTVPAGFAYVVEIDNTNADTNAGTQLTQVQTVWATATFAQKENFDHGTSTYYVISSAVLAIPTGDARIVKLIGAVPAKCTLTTPVTTAWVLCGDGYKVTRDLCLTVSNDPCVNNATQLAAIQAFYTNNTEIVPGTLLLDVATTDCIARFNVSQYNNAILEDGCDTFGSDGAKFNDLPTFEGMRWEVCPCVGWTVNGAGCPVPPVPTDVCCQCGLKFTTKSFDEIYGDCTWDINEYLEKDPITLSVQPLLPDGEFGACTVLDVSFTKVQSAKLRSLQGRDVIKEILLTRFDRQEKFLNQTDKEGLLFLQREGINYGVDLNAYYYEISIVHNVERVENHTYFGEREEVNLFIHEKDVLFYELLKGQLSATFPNAKVELL